MEVTLLIPVLNRPHNVKPLLRSVEASLTLPQNDFGVNVLFITSPDDREEQQAVESATNDTRRSSWIQVPWKAGDYDYAKKINYGCAFREESEWIFTGADDLKFHFGWDAALVRATNENPNALVVGTQDLGNGMVMRGEHATHSFVKEYEWCNLIDDFDVLHEGYCHNYVDTELIQRAQYLGVFTFANDCVIEHMHYLWGKSPHDRTYQLGQAKSYDDSVLFLERRQLWQTPCD